MNKILFSISVQKLTLINSNKLIESNTSKTNSKITETFRDGFLMLCKNKFYTKLFFFQISLYEIVRVLYSDAIISVKIVP